jgi:hypothetical protein
VVSRLPESTLKWTCSILNHSHAANLVFGLVCVHSESPIFTLRTVEWLLGL